MDVVSEKEKMLAGEPYDPRDPQLADERRKARALVARFNAAGADEGGTRRAVLAELFGSIGEGAEIEPPFHCDYGANIHAGRDFFMNFGGVVLDCARVRIGDNVYCGPYVQIYAAHHPVDPRLRLVRLELAHPVVIGDNVWLGGGVIVCPGVTVGDNTTVGAGSIVTRDIPANVVAAGNPCRVIRRL